MTTVSLPTPAGDPVPLPNVTASALKNSTADVLDRVLVTGGVVITRHDKERAVMLSMEAFRRLVEARRDDLEVLRAKFGGLLESMQAPAARKGVQDAFDADPAEMGKAAVKAARRRV